MGTVEDLYPQAYVLPYLIPMLENAGAYVLTPRERDVSTQEIIVDFDGGYAQKATKKKNGSKKWHTADGLKGFGYKKEILTGTDNPFRMGSVRQIQTVTNPDKASAACWYADFKKAGTYAVYVSYASLPNSAGMPAISSISLAGSKEFEINQRIGGGTWIYLGSFPFAAGRSKTPVVELLNVSSEANQTITADAVKSAVAWVMSAGRQQEEKRLSALIRDSRKVHATGCSGPAFRQVSIASLTEKMIMKMTIRAVECG